MNDIPMGTCPTPKDFEGAKLNGKFSLIAMINNTEQHLKYLKDLYAIIYLDERYHKK